MEKLKTLNLKIPAEIHKILKSYAAEKDISVVKKAEDLLIESIKSLKD